MEGAPLAVVANPSHDLLLFANAILAGAREPRSEVNLPIQVLSSSTPVDLTRAGRLLFVGLRSGGSRPREVIQRVLAAVRERSGPTRYLAVFEVAVGGRPEPPLETRALKRLIDPASVALWAPPERFHLTLSGGAPSPEARVELDRAHAWGARLYASCSAQDRSEPKNPPSVAADGSLGILGWCGASE